MENKLMSRFLETAESERSIFLAWLSQHYPDLAARYSDNVDPAFMKKGKMTISNRNNISYPARQQMIRVLGEYYNSSAEAVK